MNCLRSSDKFSVFRVNPLADVIEGRNLPTFQALQLDFTAHVRNPLQNPIPADIEPRRMAIYTRLIYNNIESFCSTRFETTKKILGTKAWHELIRDFVHRHQSKSPYFAQISEEFIAFVATERSDSGDAPFLLELCHYEWLPLYLDRMVGEIPPYRVCDEPLKATLKTSDLVQVRRYEWPVHKLAPDYQPDEPPERPTWVMVFRNRADKVNRKVVDAFTANLVELLRTPMQAEAAAAKLLSDQDLSDSARRERLSVRLDDLIELDVLIAT